MHVAVNLNNMDELEILEKEAGLDAHSQDYQLRQSLAQEDDNLLEELVRLRKAKGLSQQDVADRMNRNRSAVCNFERLGHDPHLSTIRRYAAAIGACIRHEVRDADLIPATEYYSHAVPHLTSSLVMMPFDSHESWESFQAVTGDTWSSFQIGTLDLGHGNQVQKRVRHLSEDELLSH